MNSWRDYARPIIANVLAENAGKSDAEIKKALFNAYPFGQRKYHPYKIWLDEIRVQLKQKKARQDFGAEQKQLALAPSE